MTTVLLDSSNDSDTCLCRFRQHYWNKIAFSSHGTACGVFCDRTVGIHNRMFAKRMPISPPTWLYLILNDQCRISYLNMSVLVKYRGKSGVFDSDSHVPPTWLLLYRIDLKPIIINFAERTFTKRCTYEKQGYSFLMQIDFVSFPFL